MMGHEILTKFVGTQFSQFGCPATVHTVIFEGRYIVYNENKN